jgi:hypothetical protein
MSVGGTLIGKRARLDISGLSNVHRGRYQAPMTANYSRLAALFGAIVAAAALRLVPHPPNFSPIDAMALFSGAYLGRRALAFAAPLSAMLLSDAFLGFYSGVWVTYIGIAAVVLIGRSGLQTRSPFRIGVAAVASSVVFFLISNFGTWALSGMYPHNLAGLGACYVAAIPFLQNTVAGDLFYAVLLFGGFALAEHLAPRLRAGGTQPA